MLSQENSDQQKTQETLNRAGEEVRRLTRTLRTLGLGLGKCNCLLVHATDELRLFQSVCQILVETGGFRLVWIGHCEDDAEKTVRAVAKAGYGIDDLEDVKISWGEETEMGQGPTGSE